MTRRELGAIAAGILITRALDGLARSSRAGAEGDTLDAAAAGQPAPAGRNRALTIVMLGLLTAGVVLMVFFEHAVTRVAGVACLFGFVVTGVFLIADPAFLGEPVEEDPA